MMPKPDWACALNCRGHLLCRWQTVIACVPWLHHVHVFLYFCCSVWYGGKWEYPFCTICGRLFFSFHVFWNINALGQVGCLQTEWRDARRFSGQLQELVEGTLFRNIRVQKLLHLILVGLCLSWACCPRHSPFQAHSLKVGAGIEANGAQPPALFITQMWVFARRSSS